MFEFGDGDLSGKIFLNYILCLLVEGNAEQIITFLILNLWLLIFSELSLKIVPLCLKPVLPASAVEE